MTHSPNVLNVTAADFKAQVLEASHQRPVLVDFWAEWCAPCRMLGPILDSLAQSYAGKLLVAKVDTEAEKELAMQFNVRSLPTVKLFRNGQPVDEFLGALPESEIRAFLAPHLPRESDALVAETEALLAGGAADRAAERLAQARADDPDNPRLPMLSVRVEAALGNFDAAEEALDKLPMDQHDLPEAKLMRASLLFDRVIAAAPEIAALEQRLATDPNDSEARFQLAARQVDERNYEAALENLLALLRKDRKYGDDAARKAMVQLFELLGGDGDLVANYRAKMMNALF